MKGVKYDKDKPRWSLLPLEPVREIVKVMTFGAKKYADNNWKHINDLPDRYYSAMMRHIYAHVTGEWLDPETKLPHLAHAGCCLLFWMWYELRQKHD